MASNLRDSWCTPKDLADLIGQVKLDPCSNDRSHIRAEISLDDIDDGLEFDIEGLDESEVVFLNPGYSRGQVERWVQHYRNTRFIFLLRWDPSTRWFSELWPYCTHFWLPTKRISFEPPPGVKASSNPFPHGLYLRDPSPELLERLRPHGYLLIKGDK